MFFLSWNILDVYTFILKHGCKRERSKLANNSTATANAITYILDQACLLLHPKIRFVITVAAAGSFISACFLYLQSNNCKSYMRSLLPECIAFNWLYWFFFLDSPSLSQSFWIPVLTLNVLQLSWVQMAGFLIFFNFLILFFKSCSFLIQVIR